MRLITRLNTFVIVESKLNWKNAISCRWYHGRLDRFTAEERLWDASKMGSYLVRESDRKPGSYVLSYLGRTGINHFRITAVCGDYYIGMDCDV